jgi:DNA polymerase-3 subunit chi
VVADEMTNISFHFNVADTLMYACRLIRKAWQQESPVLVIGEAAWLDELDGLLWTFSATDFIPHSLVGVDADDVSDAKVNVWLAEPDQINTLAANYTGFLIHCGTAHSTHPIGFERFDRLIEIVAADEATKALARQRWIYYKERGYPLTHRDAKN